MSGAWIPLQKRIPVDPKESDLKLANESERDWAFRPIKALGKARLSGILKLNYAKADEFLRKAEESVTLTTGKGKLASSIMVQSSSLFFINRLQRSFSFYVL